MHFDVLDRISALASPVRHYDACVFPDDSDWYRRFESLVSAETDRCRIGHAHASEARHEVLLPMQLTGGGSGLSVLESLDNFYSCDFRPICSSKEAQVLIGPLIDMLLKREAPHLFWLRAMDVDAPETALIVQALKDLGWATFTSVQQINWTHAMPDTYEDYLSTRPARVRNTLRRKTARLMALPGMSLTVHYGNDDIDLDLALDAYNEIYSRSWKVPEPYPDFIPQLIRATAERGQLRLGILRMNDTPVAAHFWIVKHHIAYIYKLAHDQAFDRYSPGTVLLGQMIRHTKENDQINRLDFLSGDDPYKRDWMSDRREKIQIRAYNPRSPRAQFVQYRDEYMKPFVRQFKERRVRRDQA